MMFEGRKLLDIQPNDLLKSCQMTFYRELYGHSNISNIPVIFHLLTAAPRSAKKGIERKEPPAAAKPSKVAAKAPIIAILILFPPLFNNPAISNNGHPLPLATSIPLLLPTSIKRLSNLLGGTVSFLASSRGGGRSLSGI
jgi:hypothetical protein